jgi:DUF1680 family protein
MDGSARNGTVDAAPSPTRRGFLQALGTAAVAPLLPASAAAPGHSRPMPAVGLADVRLGPGPFADAQARNLRYLAALEVERLLAPYRIEAGLAPRADKYPNWESMGLDGHTAGHVLSALASLAAQGEPLAGERLDAMLAGLAECQQANGDGYLGGVPGGRRLWTRIASGEFKAEAFSLDGAWVPFYNLHKMYAGLRDAWLLAGRRDARDMLLRFADWCEALVAHVDDATLQRILDTEHGGMNEVLADCFAISGERRYLRLARRFSHRALLEPLLRREDRLDGLHANTQIPKVIGFARIGELDGDQAWIDAARFFWETVALRRSVAFGGNSVREHFHPVDDASTLLASREGPETCNSYNMLRLTALLHRLDPQPRYADFYERVLYNHILSTQHPGHGGLVYFTPVRPRHYRVYSQPTQCFWCCVGSGLENHARHGAFACSHDGETLSVNLYMPAHVHWRERGVRLEQRTRFPDEPRTRLELALDAPRAFTLRLRHPAWLEGPLQVRINGRPRPLSSAPGQWADIARTWSDGDRVEVELPMHTRVEPLFADHDWVALMHGPLLLAARTGEEDLDGLVADDGRGSHIAPGPYLPMDGAPMLVGARDALASHVRPVPGAPPLTFEADALLRPASARGLRLEPFFRIHDARYACYWRTTTEAGYPAVLAAFEAAERERQALEARTLDRVQPGEQQPEIEHGYAGEESATGQLLGRRWRDARGWFGYRLAPRRDASAPPRALMLVLFGGDWNVAMDVEAGGEVVERIVFEGGGRDDFDTRLIPLPQALAARAGAEGLELRFIARDGRRTPRVFEVRLLSGE